MIVSQPEKNYDAEFCGSIPLNFINLIQPHGLLIVLSRLDLKIVQVSDNVEEIAGIAAKDLINKSLAEFTDAAQLSHITNRVAEWNIKDKIPVSLSLSTNGRVIPFSVIMHYKEKYVLLELEKSNEQQISEAQNSDSFLRIYQEVKYIIAALKEARSVEEIARIAALEIRKLSGFDRVMIYQFDRNWNGTVIAEAREEDLEPYLSLQFPASDIPKQARDLYFSNPFRLIPDRTATPAKLFPVINPIVRGFTDLSECSLRSVPAVHLEYLANMGVTASMSTAIIKDGKLWGLISCHHKTAKNLSYALRSAFELLSLMISAQLAAKENEQAFLVKKQLDEKYMKLLENIYSEDDLHAALSAVPLHLINMLNLGGAALVYNGELIRLGNTPDDEEVRGLISWLSRNNGHKAFLTDSLPSQYEPSRAYADVASGLVALPIATQKGSFVLGFRPEVLQTVQWGGDPNHAIQLEPDGKTYHPRHSFSIWQETVKYTCLPWLPEEENTAEALRVAILERTLKDKV